MAGLIEIHQLEAFLGFDIDTDDEPRVQTYIDLVSNFIETAYGVSFSEHTGAVIKAKSDGSGCIEIEALNVVSLVEFLDPWTNVWADIRLASIYYAWNDTWGHSGYAFDGISMIYNLCPRQTYRITCDYGFTAVPDEIKDIVCMLVSAGTGLDAAATGGLKSYRVGDVEEAYGVSSSDGGPVVSLSSMMTAILNGYSTANTTYRL